MALRKHEAVARRVHALKRAAIDAGPRAVARSIAIAPTTVEHATTPAVPEVPQPLTIETAAAPKIVEEVVETAPVSEAPETDYLDEVTSLEDAKEDFLNCIEDAARDPDTDDSAILIESIGDTFNMGEEQINALHEIAATARQVAPAFERMRDNYEAGPDLDITTPEGLESLAELATAFHKDALKSVRTGRDNKQQPDDIGRVMFMTDLLITESGIANDPSDDPVKKATRENHLSIALARARLDALGANFTDEELDQVVASYYAYHEALAAPFRAE